MIIKIDKLFIAELQAKGYDIDYKTLTEIYKDSRNREYKKTEQESKETFVKYRWDSSIKNYVLDEM